MKFIKLLTLCSLATVSALFSAEAAATTVPEIAWQRQKSGKTHIISSQPGKKWEEGLVSGNGVAGVMVFGDPHSETIVVNHEKCWAHRNNYLKRVPEVSDLVKSTRYKGKKGSFGSGFLMLNQLSEWFLRNNPSEELTSGWGAIGHSGSSYHTHPAFNIKWQSADKLSYDKYFREMVLDDAEVNVYWEDNKGGWERNMFVSQSDDVIVWRFTSPKGGTLNGTLSLAEPFGMNKKEVTATKIDYSGNELYFFNSYAYTSGLPYTMGYHAVGRLINKGGSITSTEQGVLLKGVDELLMVMRVEYLDNVATASRERLRDNVQKVVPNYKKLLATSSKIHSAMQNRVEIVLGEKKVARRTTEQIIARAEKEGMTAEMAELLHSLGRYTLICSSGEYPPALMGVWGGNWNAAWNGHYTYDSNMQLAISAASSGNLPEAIESFTNLMESCFKDWEENAKNIFDARGYHVGMGSAWYPGSARCSNVWFPAVGLGGWLSAYYEEYYSCSGDQKFLLEKEIPFLKNLAFFYEDFLEGAEGKDGKYLFFPSISPENIPDKLPGTDIRTYISPNPTSEIAMCKFVLQTLIKHCKNLGIEQQGVAKWEGMVAKLPNYLIDDNGALAEWSYPGVEASYTNKTAAQYFGVYPGDEISRWNTPELYTAAKVALKYRSGPDTYISGHGMLHDCFVAARLAERDIFWQRLDIFPKTRFFYSSMLSAHFSNLAIYNLDSSLALPAIIVEMLVSSAHEKELNILPVLDFAKIPTGSASGILARGAVTVEKLSWNSTTGLVELWLTSKSNQMVDVSLPKNIKTVEGAKCTITKSTKGNNFKAITLTKGVTAKLKFEI